MDYNDHLQSALVEDIHYLDGYLSSTEHLRHQQQTHDLFAHHRENEAIQQRCQSLLQRLQDPTLTQLPIIEIIRDDYSSFDDLQAEEEESAFEERILRLNTKNGQRKRQHLITLTSLIMKLNNDKRTMLLRDVYYCYKYLFKSQNECNAGIFQTGKLLKMKRYQMNILPSAKGFITGPIRFRFDRRSPFINCSPREEPRGVSVDYRWMRASSNDIDIEILNPNVRFLIVVEKECIFHRLIDDNFTRKIPCILITGCGFPDVATRAAVHKISKLIPLLDVVGICDYNPFGISLLSSYRKHCSSTSFEAFGYQTNLRWLGLRGSHLQRIIAEYPAFSSTMGQPLTLNDKRRILSMMSAKEDKYHHQDVYRELMLMLQGNLKFELESLYYFGIQFFEDYMIAAIVAGDFVNLD